MRGSGVEQFHLLLQKTIALSMRGTIVIAGSIAQKPWHGGHTWVFLQYLLGFKKLGWDVLFVDSMENLKTAPDDSPNVHYLRRVMDSYHPDGAYALFYNNGSNTVGLSRKEVVDRTARAAMILNVMGFLRDEEILGAARQRVFLDIDPGFGQMWHELGLSPLFQNHDQYLTVGANIGQPSCRVPDCGIPWIPTLPPVCLDYWKPVSDGAAGRFTTVASWRGAYGPVEFGGNTYGLRVHEFRKFATLPSVTDARFEIALDIHEADAKDRHLLENAGWRLLPPQAAAGDPERYQRFIQDSGAEFMVAKNMYVDTASGWFSDRSVCYLASGKPVLVQDTGLQSLYPTEKGLLTFRSLEEAVAGVREIFLNYSAHSRAARHLAVEMFDSSKVLGRVLDRLSIH